MSPGEEGAVDGILNSQTEPVDPTSSPLELHRWFDLPEPPPQPWVIPDWMPSGALTLLSGPGGAGKSRLALQLAAGVAGGESHWIDGARQYGLALDDRLHGGAAVVYASWEDRPAVIARQLAALSGPDRSWVRPNMPLHLPGAPPHGIANMGPLYMMAPHQQEPDTHLATRLRAAAAKVRAALVVLDSLAAVYSASEIDRAAVRGFLASWDAWAYEQNCAVLILSHPPKSGADYSGSTDWLAGVRALWTLTKELHGQERKHGKQDDRPLAWRLACVKSNYADEGPPGPLRLNWEGPALTVADTWDYDPTATN